MQNPGSFYIVNDMGQFGDFLIRIMRQIGFGICHQIGERSLSFGGRVLPVCARCTGIFLGFAVCLTVLLVAYRGRPPRYPSWPKIAFLVLLFVPTTVDAVTSYAGLRESGNAIRMVTGALAGTAIAALLLPLVAGALLQVRHVDFPEERARMLEPAWAAPALLAVPALLSLAIWPSWPGAFWFWALLVTASILFTLLALNFTLVVLVLEGLRVSESASAPAWFTGIAVAAVIAELVVSNRLHWLVQRTL
jgi:uncharacterized membrane protein